VACSLTLTQGGTGKGVRVGVGVKVIVGVGVRNGVRVGVGVSVGTKKVALGDCTKVGKNCVLPEVGKAVGITNIGVDDGVTVNTNTGVELACWVDEGVGIVGDMPFCGVEEVVGVPCPGFCVIVGKGDGWFTVVLAVGEADAVVALCPEASEVGVISEVAWELGSG
jgi:hypothetical protein